VLIMTTTTCKLRVKLPLPAQTAIYAMDPAGECRCVVHCDQFEDYNHVFAHQLTQSNPLYSHHYSLRLSRILGGIGVIAPWWPIKAYRPCPTFTDRGGIYQRSGQGLDEIAFGRDNSFDNNKKDAGNNKNNNR
jgi:hypothetical protein